LFSIVKDFSNNAGFDNFLHELKFQEFYDSLFMQQDSFIIWTYFAQHLLFGYLLNFFLLFGYLSKYIVEIH